MRSKSNLSIRVKLRNSIISVLGLAMFLALLMSTASLIITSYKSVRPPMRTSANFATSIIESRLDAIQRSVEVIGLLDTLYAKDVKDVYKTNTLNNLKEELHLESIILSDYKGNYLIGEGYVGDTVYHKEALEGKTYVSSLDESNNVIYVSTPIWRDGIKNSFIEGSVIASVSTETLLNIDTGLDEDLMYFVLDDKKSHLYSDTKDTVKLDGNADNVRRMINNMYSKDRGFIYTLVGGGLALSHDIIEEYNWKVAVAYPLILYTRPLIFGFLGMLLVFAISIIITRKVANRIGNDVTTFVNYFGNIFKKLRLGELDIEFKNIDTNTELKELSEVIQDTVTAQTVLIDDITYVLNQVSNRNLKVESRVGNASYVGEYRVIYESLDTLKVNMLEFINCIKASAENVESGSTQMALASHELAQGTTTQAHSIDELYKNVNEISMSVERNMQTTEKIVDDVVQLNETANKSEEAMKKLLVTVKNIQDISTNITKIIEDINSISSETNLLSLNAMIESARAGMAGAGFAVVARSIGKLAEQSKTSATETCSLIEQTHKAIDEGVIVTSTAAREIQSMIDSLRDLSLSIQTIMKTSVEQRDSIMQLKSSAEHISEVVQNNSAAAEEQSATSEELASQAQSLDELVKNFIT